MWGEEKSGGRPARVRGKPSETHAHLHLVTHSYTYGDVNASVVHTVSLYVRLLQLSKKRGKYFEKIE